MSPHHGQPTTTTPDAEELVGFQVEAYGGAVGHVDPASSEVPEPYLVVRRGIWPFRRKVVLRASKINCVDPQRRRLYLQGTRDEYRSAPEYNARQHSRQQRQQTLRRPPRRAPRR